MNTYGEFLANKVIRAPEAGLDGKFDLHPALFDFQRHCVEFALRKGRAALFLDTGLGKTICQLEWSRHVAAATDAPALILAPLAVAWQIDREGKLFGYDCRVIRNMSGVGPGINICNYDRLDHLDPSAFGSVSLDESSILKSFDGKTTRALVDAFSGTRFRLCCTATPAPNDHMELGTHSEFLGILRPNEMLSRWFVNDTSTASQSWRLKGHARDQFWQWVASWARMASTPEDLGYDGSAFDLPPMRIERHKVNAPIPKSAGLFGDAVSATGMFEIKRQSAAARVAKVAELVAAEPAETWVVWCDTDHESGMLTRAIGVDAVEVKGSLPADEKERRLRMFADGERRVIVTKPKLAGFGLNWQHAARVAFVGRTFSYEAYYQAVRRCWRFGQSREVVVHLVIDDAEASIGAVVERKAEQHEEMKRAMATAMRSEVSATGGRMTDYCPTHDADGIMCLGHRRTQKSVIYHGDCVDVVRQMPDASVDFCVYSPPFGDLFVYSDSALDMGNSSSHGEFAEHYAFLVREIIRVIKPGRLVSVHCSDLPARKWKDGYIGLLPFSDQLVQIHIAAGFTYIARTTVWKDPVVEMQRTKALGLLHKQIKKDSTRSRTGMPDYVLTFMAPGENAAPVSHSATDFPVEQWQQWASPVWMDINQTDVLNSFRSARGQCDEKHICPLQLDLIRRLIVLYSNPNEVVLSPFAGIGSEGYVAMKTDRRFVGVELKKEYFEQAAQNIAAVEAQGVLL